jgi:hypothetical protein
LLMALWSIRYSSMRLIRRGMSITWGAADTTVSYECFPAGRQVAEFFIWLPMGVSSVCATYS